MTTPDEPLAQWELDLISSPEYLRRMDELPSAAEIHERDMLDPDYRHAWRCWICAVPGAYQRGPLYWFLRWHLRRMASQ